MDDDVDPVTGYLAAVVDEHGRVLEPGREPGSDYWRGPAGDELRRLERLALAGLARREAGCG